jgi:hypothetical protein
MKRNQSTTLLASQVPKLGSDLGLNEHLRGPPISSSFLRNFLAGCAASFLSPFSQSTWNSVSRQSSRSTGECQISLGKFRGKEYTTETGGTGGQPTCLVESKFLEVQQRSVRMPNDETGSIIADWLWIHFHDSINVLVEAEKKSGDKEPHFLVFEQTKYALEGRMSLASVGGIIEPHEEPEQAARRERDGRTAMRGLSLSREIPNGCKSRNGMVNFLSCGKLS